MQYEPLKELQRIEGVIKHVDFSVAQESEINIEKVEADLHDALRSIRPSLEEISQAFNATDQAKSIKSLVHHVDRAMDAIHVLEDTQVFSPVEAGEVLSALGWIADYADSIIDPDFLKTSIN